MSSSWSPVSWAAEQSPVALMVIRVLLVANIGLLTAVGAICLAFVSRPAGTIAAGLSWGFVVALLFFLPHTKPRRDNSRW